MRLHFGGGLLTKATTLFAQPSLAVLGRSVTRTLPRSTTAAEAWIQHCGPTKDGGGK